MTVGYAYYRDFFGGATVLEEEFPIFEKKACAYIRYLTSGRSDSIVMDAVKDAVCAVCEVYAAEEARVQAQEGNRREIASENNDGYSASFVTESQAGQTYEETIRRKTYQAAYPYLAFTGLLNRKVFHAYQCGHYHL